ncbi:bola protein [Absidia repens]|uniref:Bola protein n=1 Tax=Absidia repens TaxID=90262 RepID=A0A1X2HYZ8_9FUNG|nr:bola protein [Absidia repens]
MRFHSLLRPLTRTRLYTTSAAPEGLSAGESHIYNKLQSAFEPLRLRVSDVSGGCGSMYAIDIASTSFEGKSIVKQHRLINDLLKEELRACMDYNFEPQVNRIEQNIIV